jgi:hypothetical protein
MRELTWFPLLESYPKTSAWGARVDPITGATSSWHRGVDYGVPYGEPVIAPFDGQVNTGYEDGGAGHWSWLVNGSDMFKSFHHSSVAVAGGWVSAGTTIAHIGSTGSSTGAHAHLELWEAGTNIDPTGYLDRAPLYGGASKPQPEGDEMTDEDWNHMASLLNTMIVGKLANHTTPRVLISDSNGQFAIVMTDEGPRRYTFGSPAEVTLAQRLGWVAPQKPVSAPNVCPPAVEVSSLTPEERDVLYSYPIL